MAGGTDSEDEITGINVTPLVDVMLVLLIIFMVTASYIVNQSINVNLPKAESGDQAPQTKNLAFVLDGESQLYLDGKAITYDQVVEKIKTEKKEAKDRSLTALISADEETPHGAVVKLIDTVRKHGVSDFAINVEASVGESASVQ